MRQHLLDLAALQVADEVPRELADAPRALASSSCARFSPTTRDAGLGEHAELLERDVLDRREDLDVRVAPRDLRRARARGCRRRARRRGRGSAPPREPRLAAGDAAVAAVGEEALGRRTIVHRPPSWTSATPAACSRARATALRSSVRSRACRTTRAHLVADLVAAGPARARSPRATRPAPPSARHAGLEHAAGQPAPAGVDARRRPPARQRDRQAVGDEHDRGDARRASSTWPSASSPSVAVDDDARPVDLAALREALGAGLRAHALAVGRHALGVVVGQQRRGSATRTGPPRRRRGAS